MKGTRRRSISTVKDELKYLFALDDHDLGMLLFPLVVGIILAGVLALIILSIVTAV